MWCMSLFLAPGLRRPGEGTATVSPVWPRLTLMTSAWPFREATAVLQSWGFFPEARARPGLSVCTQCCPGPVSHLGPGPGKPVLASTMSPTAFPSDVWAWGPARDCWMFGASARWVLERGPSWCFPALFQEAQPMEGFLCPPGQNRAGHPSWLLAPSPG